MNSLSGKVAFITGAASGLGLAMAHAFSEQGMRLVLTDVDGERLQYEADKFGKDVLAVAFDVTDRHAWQCARDEAVTWGGAVDVLCNNAGIGPDGNQLADMDPISFDRMIQINLTSVFNGVSAFSDLMKKRGGGHIVNTASMAGFVASAGLGGYTATKFAVAGMSEVLHKELAPYDVGVTVFCPGFVRTRLAENTSVITGLPTMESPKIEGMEASVAVQAVLHAIKNNQLYAFSHKDYRQCVSDRFDSILKYF